MRVLVAYGSKRGGTEGIAEGLAAALRSEGLDARVEPAGAVRDLAGYDAVLVGGALYAGLWHADARRFVLAHVGALRARRAWFFSSGPLDESARGGALAPTPEVRALMEYAGAEGHETFGGRLARDAKGFPAAAMARTRAGDWRDPAAVESWARSIARRLRDEGPEPALGRTFVPLPSRTAPLVLSAVAGVSAVAGGAALVASPDGSLVKMPLAVLRHSPFASFFVPGLLLVCVVGGSNLWAAALQLRRSSLAAPASVFAGGALLVWIVVQMALLRSANGLQLATLVTGVSVLAAAAPQVRALLANMRPATASPR